MINKRRHDVSVTIFEHDDDDWNGETRSVDLDEFLVTLGGLDHQPVLHKGVDSPPNRLL